MPQSMVPLYRISRRLSLRYCYRTVYLCRCDICCRKFVAAILHIVLQKWRINLRASAEGRESDRQKGRLRVQKSISAPSRPLCAANTAITAIWRQVNWRFPTSRCETEVPMPSNKKKNSPGPGCYSCNAVLVGASAHNAPPKPPYHEK